MCFINYTPCQTFSVSWAVLALSALAEVFVVFIKSVGVFFQNGFIVLVQKRLHVAGATVANMYGMSVKNTVKFVAVGKMFVKEL